MSTLKKKQAGNSKQGKSSDKSIPKGVVIVDGDKEIFIKKEFIGGFGYENGSQKKTPFDQKTFHQKINNELPRKQEKKEICLLGPNPGRMGKRISDSFEDFMRQNSLRKGARYEVRQVLKEK